MSKGTVLTDSKVASIRPPATGQTEHPDLKVYRDQLAEVERLAIEGLAREQSVEWGKVHEDQKIQEWRRRDRLLRLADRILDQWEEHPERCSTLEGLARVMELALNGRQVWESCIASVSSERRRRPVFRWQYRHRHS